MTLVKLSNLASHLMSSVLQQDFKTCRTIVHEAYNAEGKKEHDIALIQISQDSDIFPVALNKEKVDPGREVRALGWGRTETQRLSNELQQLELEVMSNPKCSETYRETFSDCDKCIVPTIKDGMMCAQARIQADVCKGIILPILKGLMTFPPA